MQPIATPDRTIDSTIGSSRSVAGGEIERALLERVRLHHHDLLVRVAIVLIRREGNVAVNAGEIFQLVPVTDDLLWLGADILDRLDDQMRSVVADRDPPQQRVAHVDL